jgi:hypothetical protein
MKRVLTAVALLTFVAGACEEKPASPSPTPAPAPKGASAPAQPGHGGPVIDLGTSTIGPYSVHATRDGGEIKAGGDSPIDVRVTGEGPKVAVVRFWIGTQDAAGSIKAKAEIEDPNDPNRWHTHAEVPEPLPADAALWVEIEDEKGVKSVGSFGLKA